MQIAEREYDRTTVGECIVGETRRAHVDRKGEPPKWTGYAVRVDVT